MPAKTTTLADIRRVQQLVFNDVAMTIMYELADSPTPSIISHAGDAAAAAEAVRLLEQMDLIRTGHEPGIPPSRQPVALTTRGVRFLRAIGAGVPNSALM